MGDASWFSNELNTAFWGSGALLDSWGSPASLMAAYNRYGMHLYLSMFNCQWGKPALSSAVSHQSKALGLELLKVITCDTF